MDRILPALQRQASQVQPHSRIELSLVPHWQPPLCVVSLPAGAMSLFPCQASLLPTHAPLNPSPKRHGTHRLHNVTPTSRLRFREAGKYLAH
jgi:hypothetical protein